MSRFLASLSAVLLFAGLSLSGEPLTLRAVRVPTGDISSPQTEADLRVRDAFLARHPDITLLPATGLTIPGRSTMDTQPLMQIAGDVSPDVIYVNFRQSDTYIRNRFLYPLDRYIERIAGVDLPDGPFLSTDDYYAALSRGPHFDAELRARMPRILWDVVRRECPYGADCPYLDHHNRVRGNVFPVAHPVHYHTWAAPYGQVVTALFYRKDLFADAGLPDRAPETCDEFLSWARQLTNPKENTYGLRISTASTGYSTLSFLYSFGGRAVSNGEPISPPSSPHPSDQPINTLSPPTAQSKAEVNGVRGNVFPVANAAPGGIWRCCFDSPAAVDAYTFVARIFLEPYTNRFGRFETVLDPTDGATPGVRNAMWFSYLDQTAFEAIDPNVVGFGPVPKGPDGTRGSEYNCMMLGLYAGSVDDNPRLRDLAWDYLWFQGSREADLIRARTFVESGLGRFVQPDLLREAGYEDEADSVPAGWAEANAIALEHGIPEPYGRNCQLVYDYLSRAIDQIRNDPAVRDAIRSGHPDAARPRIEAILHERVRLADEKMIGLVPPDVQRRRRAVAAAAVAIIALAFALVFRKVLRTFQNVAGSSPVRTATRAQPRAAVRSSLPYLLLLPALATIAVWAYWPLLRGTTMAFQDYNVRGFSTWVGFDNFATVLFNAEFWHAMLMALKYCALNMTFGFCTPIILAILLSEVPRGKILYRTIFYLPAVLSGVVVLFLWKGFYGPYGMINQLLNAVLHAVNAVFGTAYPDLATNWLSNPSWALFFCLLPSIWAGAGPGCLIYLAALKTVPDDLYEAADIEGAGVLAKIRHITLPSIKSLVLINFIGALIGSMQSSGYILLMTGGGPYTPYGATEVVGLHIFCEAFGYLRFGAATAMAWVLGSMLIGFTVFQLQRLSRMEFRASGSSERRP